MIDRETAIQWAEDAGFNVRQYNTTGGITKRFAGNSVSLEALISRVRNEALEEAASIANGLTNPKVSVQHYGSWCQGTVDAAKAIQTLKKMDNGGGTNE